jgi:type II secretory pathway predicted ATPase ExeA
MIPAARKSQLLAMGLPDDTQTIRRARAFALKAGFTLGELADMAALNPNSLRVYMSGNYDAHKPAESNTLNIRAALKELMDLYEIELAPEALGTHYDTAEYETIRRSMWTALRHATACLVDGPPGTQKTYAMRRVADEINRSGKGRAVYVYARVEHGPQSFLVECCTEAGIPSRGTIDQLLRKLRFLLGRGRTLLLVDEAQHLGMQTLEVLRQLLDTPPFFGVVLGGSHDLSVRLRDWRMEQWRSRLRRTHLLAGLNEAEAAMILVSELGPMKQRDIADSIADATVEAVRDRKAFRYISVRNLFFAIDDAKRVLVSQEAS